MKELFDDVFSTEEIETPVAQSEVITLLELNDLDAVEAEMREIETAIEVAETTVASLESLVGALTASKEEGGLSQQGALFAHAAIDAAVAPIGVAVELPSMESYEEEGGRIAATDYSVEKVVATMKKIWMAIKSFVSKWVGNIANFFNALLGGASGLAKAATALAAKAKDAKGSPAEKELEISGSQFSALSIDNKKLAKATDYTQLTKDLTKLKPEPVGATWLRLFAKALSELNPTTAEELKASLQAFTGDAYATEEVLVGKLEEAGMTKYTGAKKTGSKKKDVTFSEGTEYYVSPAYPGNKMVQAAYRVEEGKIMMLSFNIVENDEKAKVGKTEKVPALDAAGVADAANTAAELATAIADTKVKIKDIEKDSKSLVKDGDRLYKILDKMEGEDGVSKEDITRGKTIMNNISRVASAAMEPAASMQRIGLQAAKAQYSYAKSSLKNLKEEKAA